MRLLGAALLALFALLASGVDPAAAPTPARLVFVDVDQGDAVVMRVGGKIVVSDAGEHEVEHVDAALRALRARQIDVAILSHPHDDHVKNFLPLIERYGWAVRLAVLSRSRHWRRTDTNRALMRALRERKVPLEYATAGETFRWGGGEWSILSPPRGKFTAATQAANASVCYLLRVNGETALFTGDVEATAARLIATRLAPLLDEPLDVFLATHHGSKEGSVKELLDVARPRWAVLSTGRNGFGHPSPEAIARLRAAGASIWCTDVNGNVTARMSAAGRVTWRASRQRAPWWSARARRKNGRCVGR